MEEIVSYLLAAIVTVLSGDRVYQGVRNRRNGTAPATRADMNEVKSSVEALSGAFQNHLGYHEGLKDGLRDR